MLRVIIIRDTKNIITKSRKLKLYYLKRFTLLKMLTLIEKLKVTTIKARK